MRFTIDDKHLIKWMWVKKIRRKNACSQCFWQKIKSLWWGKDTQYVHNMSPFISSSGLSPGNCEAKVQRAKVCLNCTEPSVARSSYWSLPVGRYLSDSRCQGSMVILARWTASNMAEEPQMSISHLVRKRWTTSGSSDFRIWHMASIRYPRDLAWCPRVKCIKARASTLCIYTGPQIDAGGLTSLTDFRASVSREHSMCKLCMSLSVCECIFQCRWRSSGWKRRSRSGTTMSSVRHYLHASRAT